MPNKTVSQGQYYEIVVPRGIFNITLEARYSNLIVLKQWLMIEYSGKLLWGKRSFYFVHK